MEDKIARFIVNKYKLLLFLLILVTLSFAYHIPKITIVSDITDLLSSKHPYVKLDKEFRKIFGGSNVVLIQVKARKGDVNAFRELFDSGFGKNEDKMEIKTDPLRNIFDEVDEQINGEEEKTK